MKFHFMNILCCVFILYYFQQPEAVNCFPIQNPPEVLQNSINNSRSANSNGIGKSNAESDESFDSIFKDDKFFTDFDKSVENRTDLTKQPIAELESQLQLLDKFGLLEMLKSGMNQNNLPSKPATSNVECRSRLKRSGLDSSSAGSWLDSFSGGGGSWLDIFSSGSSSILDTLGGLVGFSSIQMSTYPIIMILVAGVTGIFWSAVFAYLYGHFFTGGGYFDSASHDTSSNSDEGFGFFDNIFGKDKKKKKNQNNMYGPPVYGNYGSNFRSSRSSSTNNIMENFGDSIGRQIFGNYYNAHNLLTNAIWLGIEKFTDAYIGEEYKNHNT